MTPDDVIGEFMRADPVEGHVAYLDANAMAAEIVRLRAVVERVRGCQRLYVYDDEVMLRTGIEEAGEDGPYMRAADILAALGEAQ